VLRRLDFIDGDFEIVRMISHNISRKSASEDVGIDEINAIALVTSTRKLIGEVLSLLEKGLGCSLA